MGSTETLVQDHLIILGVLEGLERRLQEARKTATVPKDYLRDLITFSRVFIDRCHHGKEERCLFPCLEKRGMGREDGPIAVMLQEHEWGRGLVRQIDDTLTRFEAGKGTASEVFGPCDAYLALLRQHIDKENGVLYPFGELRMETGDHEQNRRCYAAREGELGAGEHERMEGLARKLSGGHVEHAH